MLGEWDNNRIKIPVRTMSLTYLLRFLPQRSQRAQRVFKLSTPRSARHRLSIARVGNLLCNLTRQWFSGFPALFYGRTLFLIPVTLHMPPGRDDVYLYHIFSSHMSIHH